MKKTAILLLILGITLLLAISPWVSKDEAIALVSKQYGLTLNSQANSTTATRIPFGFIVKGTVAACPVCPAFSIKTYYVSFLFSTHEIS